MACSEDEVKDKDNNPSEKKKATDHKIPADLGIQLNASRADVTECSRCHRVFYTWEAYKAHAPSCRG